MAAGSAHTPTGLRRYVLVFVAQLVLTGMAIAVSRRGSGSAGGAAAVLLVSAINATIVATGLMGVRQGGRLVGALILITLIFAAGLLGWPAWDVYERARAF
ncbi:MAG TPA: hypothetical protein VM032_02320 [Vicinamibacterales bacterium]|nr:hypothetical protein [Vicinamibacterales bacterium]